MPLEQLDIFEMELSASEALFRRFDISPQLNERYSVKIREGKANNYKTLKNVVIVGTLIKHDDISVAFADAWVYSDKQMGIQFDEGYAEVVEANIAQIQKIENVEPFHFETHIGEPYRVEMYKDASTTKETTWMSCYYRGMTISGKLILINLANNDVIVCNKEEVKGFYPLSLEKETK